MLFGCAASGYKVSDKGEKHKSSLTREQALKDLHKYVFKSDAQAGVCGAHTNTQFQPATPRRSRDRRSGSTAWSR